MLTCFVSGWLIVGTMFLAYLSIKSGTVVQPLEYLKFQRTFAGLGFYMLPLPSAPDLWVVMCGLAIATLVVFAVAVRNSRATPRHEAAAYLSILALGLFSYFIGRSHIHVLILVSWPFAILAFYFVDGMNSRLETWARLVVVPRFLMLASVALSAASLASSLPPAMSSGSRAWASVMSGNDLTPMELDARYIAQTSQPERTLGILSSQQGLVISALGRKSEIPGSGLNEVLLRNDAAAMAKVVAEGPDDPYIESRLLFEDYQTWGSEPWVKDGLEKILGAYDSAGESPEGTMLHLVRKAL